MSLAIVLLYTSIAGGCIPLGGLIASAGKSHLRWLNTEFRHFIIAFGAGVLLGAVAIVLIPQSLSMFQGQIWPISLIVVGGILFFYIERMLGQRRRESPQVLGMLLDFVPESIALGSMIALDAKGTLLLAVLIAAQNLPEGFNSYNELICVRDCKPSQTLLTMLGLAVLGPVSGLLGLYVFASYHQVTCGLMLVSAGGIMYLLFQDIAPQIKLEKHWLPPMGAVLGYVFSVLGETLLLG